jgi:hypothetical protein
MRSQAVPSRVSAFSSANPPEADLSFFLWVVLALSGGTSFVPGGASAFGVREQSRS